MTIKDTSARDALLRKLEAMLHSYRLKRARAAHAESRAGRAHRARARITRILAIGFKRRHSLLRKVGIGVAALAGIVAIVIGGLWWRLSTGPIALDIATPWLTSAIERNFGNKHRVEVGGTVLE